MKLKSSNNKTSIFIGILALLTVLLFLLSNTNVKKESKYHSAPDFEQKTSLDFIQISLNEKSYNKLKKKRNKALSVGILENSDTDYVPATITFNSISYNAEIRLKGDWTDHLKGDKWSFRVKLKGDKTILGMRKFSLHHPKTRGYLHEWLYLKAIKKEELIGLRYSFVEGSIHIKQKNSSNYVTKSVGIYGIEETFDKRTIESNGRKESFILKFSEDYWWGEVKKGIEVGAESGFGYGNFMSRKIDYPIRAFGESKILQDSVMNNYFKLSRGLLKGAREGDIPISDAFDIKKLAMQNAVMNLFGAKHGNSIINVRFYYNPITSKLEPIAFDGNSGQKLSKYEHFNFLLDETVKDSLYLKELTYALFKVSQRQYLDALLADNKSEMSCFQDELLAEFRFKGITINNLYYNQSILRSELDKLKQTYNIQDIETLEEIPIKNIEIPDFSRWTFNQTAVEKLSYKFKGDEVVKLSRKSFSKPAFNVINNIAINYGKNYEVSIIVRKEKNSFFGLRIQGAYPDRVDAVFDLGKGVVKGVKKAGVFKNENASIKNLGNDWYKCTLIGKINASDLRVILGATTYKTKVLGWESSTTKLCGTIVVPKSLTIKELIE